MSLGKILAGFVVGTVQVVGRAFAQAYREAAAGKGGASAAANGAKNAATKARAGMTLEEAQKILNVEPTASYEEIMKSYENLFKINEKKAGGSFYLQSKVYRAKERLELEHPELFAQAPSPTDSPKGDASASSNDTAAADSTPEDKASK
eukprot:m.129702 g.129702  ORF g.129702 m.129702 type:complete len:149 (-) comp15857_c0_seq4:2149-2595(-)